MIVDATTLSGGGVWQGYDGIEQLVAEPELLVTAPSVVTKGTSFDVGVAFDEIQESNAATLTFAYGADLFEYQGFTPAEGVTVFDEFRGDGFVMVTVGRTGDYAMQDFGAASVSVIGIAEQAEISVKVDYVLRDGGEKSIVSLTGSTIATAQDVVWPWLPGDTTGKGYVDLIDLSNIIDMFGFDTSATDWDALFKFFDFNENGKIDISDIAYVASQITA